MFWREQAHKGKQARRHIGKANPKRQQTHHTLAWTESKSRELSPHTPEGFFSHPVVGSHLSPTRLPPSERRKSYGAPKIIKFKLDYTGDRFVRLVPDASQHLIINHTELRFNKVNSKCSRDQIETTPATRAKVFFIMAPDATLKSHIKKDRRLLYTTWPLRSLSTHNSSPVCCCSSSPRTPVIQI